MFLANIAFALYLIALGVGTFLVGWGFYKSEKYAALCVNPNPNLNPNLPEGTRHCDAKGCCATTFAKILGIIVMVLAILGMICTIVCAAKVKHHWHERKEMMERNNVNPNQNNPNSTTSPQNTPSE